MKQRGQALAVAVWHEGSVPINVSLVAEACGMKGLSPSMCLSPSKCLFAIKFANCMRNVIIYLQLIFGVIGMIGEADDEKHGNDA